MCQKYPCLQNVPLGSMIWPCAVSNDEFLEKYTVEEMQQLSAPYPHHCRKLGGSGKHTWRLASWQHFINPG